MNKPSDSRIDDLLAALRRAEPTESMQHDNRNAAQASASAAVALPWWRHSISVPMPVALATAAALLITIGLHFRPDEATTATENADSPPAIVAPIPFREFEALAQASPDPRDRDPIFEDSMQYLPGVGVISRRVVYQPQEQ